MTKRPKPRRPSFVSQSQPARVDTIGGKDSALRAAVQHMTPKVKSGRKK